MFARVWCTAFVAAALAAAQGGGQMGGGGGGYGGGGGGRGGNTGGDMGLGGARPSPKASKADQIANQLKLSSDQRSEFNSILQETQKDAAPIIQQVSKSRVDLANALMHGKSEAETGPLNQALSDAQFQMMGVEVKTFQKIMELLKPNQLSKVPEAFELMADIFLQQGRGRGGRGR